MTRKGPRGLSEDDLAVWRQVAQSARPIRAGGTPKREPNKRTPHEPPTSTTVRETFRVGERARPVTAGNDLSVPIGMQLANHPIRMDAKAFGRLKRGKLKPERKLDLHGMTLAQAQPALTRFIRQAYADGLRLVVVITGKGKSGKDEGGPIPVPRGVLRHQVPSWLHANPLRPYVLQVTDAHIRHGGTGAYYVYLARQR